VEAAGASIGNLQEIGVKCDGTVGDRPYAASNEFLVLTRRATRSLLRRKRVLPNADIAHAANLRLTPWPSPISQAANQAMRLIWPKHPHLNFFLCQKKVMITSSRIMTSKS